MCNVYKHSRKKRREEKKYITYLETPNYFNIEEEELNKSFIVRTLRVEFPFFYMKVWAHTQHTHTQIP